MRRWIAAAMLVGCTVGYVKTYKPAHVSAGTGVTDSDLYTAAVRVLSDEGFSFRVQDRESGILATQWMAVPWAFDTAHHSWRATVADGRLTLVIDCEQRIPGGPFSPDSWGSCAKGRNEDWIRQAPDLVAKIAEEADHVARKHGAHRDMKPAPPAPAPAPVTHGDDEETEQPPHR